MSGIAIGLAAVSVGATVYGAIQTNKADQQAAQVDTATAAFNARYDTSLAEQLDLDTQQNIDTERQDEAVYVSRERASYAAVGVIATTGSALHAQITNVGRFIQKIQQDYVNSQLRQQSLYTQAKEGVAIGAAQASADSLKGTLALIDGAASVAGLGFSDYEKGILGGFGGGSTPASGGGLYG